MKNDAASTTTASSWVGTESSDTAALYVLVHRVQTKCDARSL